MSVKQSLEFRLSISAAEILRLYRREASTVSVTSNNGVTARFPAEHLRAFVTRDGVHGNFRIEFDQDQRFIRLQNID